MRVGRCIGWKESGGSELFVGDLECINRSNGLGRGEERRKNGGRKGRGRKEIEGV